MQLTSHSMSSSSPITPRLPRAFSSDASLVLVGSRGSGKRSLGFIAATHLGRRFITEDHYFERVTGLTRVECLQRYGNDEFSLRNIEVLHRMLEDNKTGCIIECGMGSLVGKTQNLLKEYSKAHPVVYVMRNSSHIRKLLKLEEEVARRLALGDSTHRFCSNFEYYNLYDPTSEITPDETVQDRQSPSYSFRLKDVKQDFSRFVDFITGQASDESKANGLFSVRSNPPESRSYTYALPLRISELLTFEFDLEELETGVDAIELVVDCQLPDMLKALAKSVAYIRRNMIVPVIMKIDKALFGGGRGEPAVHDAYFDVLHHCLRLAPEYLVVDIGCREEKILELIYVKGRTKIVGESISLEPTPGVWNAPDRLKQYQRAQLMGCDLARLVQSASSTSDNEDVQPFTAKIAALPQPRPPLIAYNLSAVGKTSLVFNSILTSVTHPLLREKSKFPSGSPITAQEAMQALFQSFLLDPLNFYVIGDTVSYSMMPALHNAAYIVCGMSHSYQIKEATSLVELQELSQDHCFGGASISHPFKVGLGEQLELKSSHATAIGAVNILLPLRASTDSNTPVLWQQASQRSRAGPITGWYGENLDWVAALSCLRRNISPRNAIQLSKATGLVIGAGGMARAAIYALIKLGCRKILIHNRTVHNAQKVAEHFNSAASSLSGGKDIVHVLQSRNDPWPEGLKPATMILSCVPAHSIGGRSAANFEMPLQWLTSLSGGVVLELAYEPLITPLLRQIRRIRHETGQAWVTVDGIETLCEQAMLQFELMTGRRAPRKHMRLEMLRKYQGEARALYDVSTNIQSKRVFSLGEL